MTPSFQRDAYVDLSWAPLTGEAMKPKLTYADFVAAQHKYKEGTVAWVIQEFIKEMSSTASAKQIGPSQMYILRAIQRSDLGAMEAAKVRKGDVIQFGKWLRERPGRNGGSICAATACQYVSYLCGAVQHVADADDDCEYLTTTMLPALQSAKRRMMKMQVIGKGEPRTRVPTDDELDRILTFIAERDDRARWPTQIKLLAFTLFALESTRRLGEICRLRRCDVLWDKVDADGNPTPLYMIQKVKHPTKKATNDRWFALTPLMGEILMTIPQRTEHPEERFFPFNPKSTSQAYAGVKRALNIFGLRFHDNRRRATTKWLARLKGNVHMVSKINGDTVAVIQKHYDATPPEALFGEMADLERQATA